MEKDKNNRKYPKGLSLKFNLSLCSNSGGLQKSCQNILNASFKLSDNITTAASKRIEDLKIVRNEYCYALKDNVPIDSFIDICERIKTKTKGYPLLYFRDKIQSIRETIFPTLIIIDRTDVFDAQNPEITTGKRKQYTKQTKN